MILRAEGVTAAGRVGLRGIRSMMATIKSTTTAIGGTCRCYFMDGGGEKHITVAAEQPVADTMISVGRNAEKCLLLCQLIAATFGDTTVDIVAGSGMLFTLRFAM